MTRLQENGDAPVGGQLLGTTWFGLMDVFRDVHNAAYRLIYEATPGYVLLASARPLGSIVIDGVPYPFAPYTVRFALPGQRVEAVYESTGGQPLYRFHFDIISSDGSGVPAEQLLMENERSVASASVQSLCEKIADYWRTGDEADRFASQAGFQELLHLLFKKQGRSEDVLEKAFEYMKLRYREIVTVEILAEEAGMSRYYFMRSFKERFGQSAMDCLAELRTNEAKRLLEAGGSVRDAAYAVGYKDPLYFSSQFKKQVGFPPRIYVANRKCRTAAYSWPNIGHLLSLQIIPYAAPIDQPWSDDYRRKYRFDVKVPLSHDYDFNRKALQRARPDRIVALSEMIPEEEKEKLRGIAPVLFLNWHREDWRSHLLQTARFLDREKEGEQWLARYDSKAEAMRHNVPASFCHGGLLILNISPLGIQIWGKRAGTVLYDDLGVRCARGVERIEYTEFAKVERLAAIDADALMVSVMRERQSLAEWERLQQSECWKGLKAVRNRNVYLMSGDSWHREPILEYTANRHELLLQELDLLFRAQ
ncbi:AraC family transcriptional regulator [Paenibacillus contaminans]|uniref:AraC family transcriptional regulator n=1 Tax=Paenibacillus contaminans TaxID=450362 RepID=A0A329MTV8_9BACL|nr:AraC family transcriptional regulator [Paenibacillus contaminans]RAV23341.1 AraC family transcriptional regulator [Paenibacillus contaminans]